MTSRGKGKGQAGEAPAHGQALPRAATEFIRARAPSPRRLPPAPLLKRLLVLLLASLQYKLWLGSGGQREVEALRAQVVKQEAENLGLRQRNEALKAEVEDLKSGEAAVEERARSELGMIKPGETFYRVVDDRQPAPADANPDSTAANAGAKP